MKKITYIICFLLISCSNSSYDDIVPEDPNIFLKWNKAYEEDTLDKSIIGLQWALSYLGAILPNPTTGISTQNTLIEIDFTALGFNDRALQKLKALNDVIFASEEYRVTGAIDLGRYVSLLLGAPEHYYEITGVPYLLTDLLDRYDLKEERGYVNNSGVSFENRIISFSEQNGFDQVFFCTETDPQTGAILEYETVEILPNGQPVFGIYNANGFRISSTDPAHSVAGKPAKCMWCHESGIQPLFSEQDNFEGFLPYLEFEQILSDYRNSHRALQFSLIDGVDFEATQQHTLTELLYITFMEPTAERLSIEWGMSVAEVENILSGLTTHTHEEFFYLGNLYDRQDVESFAPFSGLKVSSSVREKSAIEVNYIN